ncbi:hypothetical protein R6Q57_013577 [Mikania cordata]
MYICVGPQGAKFRKSLNQSVLQTKNFVRVVDDEETNKLQHVAWCKLKARLGVYRLIEHLRGNGVRITLASNSTRANIETKLSFLLCCYNFRTGVCAAKAAEMEVVAVPSLSRPHIYTAAGEMISSLLIDLCIFLQTHLHVI